MSSETSLAMLTCASGASTAATAEQCILLRRPTARLEETCEGKQDDADCLLLYHHAGCVQRDCTHEIVKYQGMISRQTAISSTAS